MTKQKHFKRRVRERMRKTGESYTTARLHLLETALATSVVAWPTRAEPARVRFRAQRLSRRTRVPPSLRYVTPAFGIVVALAIGVVGFLTITTEYPESPGSPYTMEGRS